MRMSSSSSSLYSANITEYDTLIEGASDLPGNDCLISFHDLLQFVSTKFSTKASPTMKHETLSLTSSSLRSGGTCLRPFQECHTKSLSSKQLTYSMKMSWSIDRSCCWTMWTDLTSSWRALADARHYLSKPLWKLELNWNLNQITVRISGIRFPCWKDPHNFYRLGFSWDE